MNIERTHGQGPQAVYVYYFRSQKEAALQRGEDCWPCKIGAAQKSVKDRITEQKTGMIEAPKVGLVIKTNHAASLESALHRKFAPLRLTGGGDEWFMTNPEEVEVRAVELLNMEGDAADDIGWAIARARVEKGLSQDELARLAGVRQATVSAVEAGADAKLKTVLQILRPLRLKLVLG